MGTIQILQLKKSFFAVLLTVCCVASNTLSVVYADETVTEGHESSVSLDYVSDVTIHTPGSIVRLYGSPEQSYAVPIRAAADCTIILDHISNAADLTVSDGSTVSVLLRGNNTLNHILATGGAQTNVCIKGDTSDRSDAMLTADQIACSVGGTNQTGANICIESCELVCRNLGCGGNGVDRAYNGGSATIANATPGSHASPNVSIYDATLTVSGSIACGGNGVSSQGSWSANASDGGSAGAVQIDQSEVTVGGSIAIGGKGGEGGIGSSYYDHISGITQSAQPVTIRNHSLVTVTGNVAKQQDLPKMSKGGKQKGLDGVTVEITDSTLTARDIASGGNGHQQIRSDVSSSAGTSYDIIGTAGGNGGRIVAKNAVITCNRAVCGANAGDYMNYQVSMYGTTTGDSDSIHHPLDGNGGQIDSDDCAWTITSCVGEKGSRWKGYANPSVYGDHRFIGGSINGIVKGAVITTDLTSVLGGDFEPSVEVRNSEEASCAKCLLKTGEELADQVIPASANELHTPVRMDDAGQLCTYLGIGKQRVRLGDSLYESVIRVRRDTQYNEFQLHAYGRLHMDESDAVIRAGSYSYLDETYVYDGDYTISGIGDKTLTVDEGTHLLIFEKTELDTLEIKGTSIVTARLDEDVKIRQILVDKGATLIIEGDGRLDYEVCEGTLQQPDGTRLFPVTLIPETPDDYDLYLNGDHYVLTSEDQMLLVLLAEGACDIRLEKTPFLFFGTYEICEPLEIRASDLKLKLNCSQAPITIADQSVWSGEELIHTQADVCLTQDDTLHPVTVTRRDAVLWLDQIAANIQIYVPEDFAGEIRDLSGAPIRLVTIDTGKTNYPMTFELDGTAYDVITNDEGYFTFVTTIGSHQFRLIIDDSSYWISGRFDVKDDFAQNRYTPEDLTETQPDTDMNPDTNPDMNPGVVEPSDDKNSQSPDGENGSAGEDAGGETSGSNGGASGSGGSTGSASGAGGSISGGSTGSGSGSAGSSSGGTSSSGSTSTGGASTGDASGGGVPELKVSSGTDKTTDENLDEETDQKTDERSDAIRNGIRISQKKICLFVIDPADGSDVEMDDTVYYTKKNVRFHITLPGGTSCSYQIIHQGEMPSQTAWKRLNTATLTLTADDADTRARSVVFRITDGDLVVHLQSAYFVIDRKRPVISGIRHLRFYHKSCHIQVRDNTMLREVRLNGKHVKSDFTLKKRGVYLLRATDLAGNRRLVTFAIL